MQPIKRMKHPYTIDFVDTMPNQLEAIEKFGRVRTKEGDRLRITLFKSREGVEELIFEVISHLVTRKIDQVDYYPVARYKVENFNTLEGGLCLDSTPGESKSITSDQVKACKRFIRRMQEVKWS